MRCRHIVYSATIVRTGSPGECHMIGYRMTFIRIDLERQIALPDQVKFEEIRDVDLVFTPQTGIFPLKFPGLDGSPERRRHRIGIFQDSAFLQSGKSEL